MAVKRKARITPRRGLLRQMPRIRRFEERCVEPYSGEEIRGFMRLHTGEEAVAAGVCHALTPDDAVVSTYREHGHALVRPRDMFAGPAFDRAREQANEIMDYFRCHGPFEPHRLPPSELEYTPCPPCPPRPPSPGAWPTAGHRSPPRSSRP